VPFYLTPAGKYIRKEPDNVFL